MPQRTQGAGNGPWTVAYLGDEGDSLSAGVLDGLSDAARRHGIRLVRFTRCADPTVTGSPYGGAARAVEARDARLRALLRSLRPDGLIFLGRSHIGPAAGVESFAEALPGVPAISIGGRYPGIPAVLCRSEDHMRHMIQHLVRHHGYRRIAYMPPRWPDLRIDAWRDALREQGLLYPELEIASSDWLGAESTGERVRRFLHLLLDEREVMLDAIVSCGPRETESLVSELEARRLRVPADIAVTGFEDGDFERYANPGVTTVDYPWSDMGYLACMRMLDILSDKPVEMETVVPGRVLYRGSCGCVSDLVHAAAVGPTAVRGEFRDMTVEQRWAIVSDLTKAFPYPSLDFLALLDGLARDVEDCRTPGMSGTPLHLLRELNTQLFGTPDSVLQARIETLVVQLRKAVMPWILGDAQVLRMTGAIFRQAQANLLTRIAQSRGRSGILSKNRAQAMQEVTLSVMTCHTRQDILVALLEALPKLDVACCSLVMPSATHPEGEGVRIDGRHRLIEPLGTVSPDGLFRDMIGRHAGHCDLAVSLLDGGGNAGATIGGYVVFDSGPLDGMMYRVLVGHLVTAIENADKADQLEQNCLLLMDRTVREGMDAASRKLLHDLGTAWDGVNHSVQMLASTAGRSPVPDLLRAEEMLDAVVANGTGDDPGRFAKLLDLFRLLGNNATWYRRALGEELDRLEARMTQLDDALARHGKGGDADGPA